MKIAFAPYQKEQLPTMMTTWNDVLADGVAFPGDTQLAPEEFANMLAEQSAVTCLYYDDAFAGFYILHPNNIGRCSHVANASYCIAKEARGKGGFSAMVAESINEAKHLGFKGLQYNAVVVSNLPAIHTYQKNDFQIVGTIPEGFRLKDGTYSDMYVMHRKL